MAKLYELALNCEPPLPLGSGNDRSQRTRLGKSLGRMRDRVFQFEFAVRVEVVGLAHKVQHWRLVRDEGRDTDERLLL